MIRKNVWVGVSCNYMPPEPRKLCPGKELQYAEGALLHLEDADHDPQQRDQQQHAEPGQLDQCAAPLSPLHRLPQH